MTNIPDDAMRERLEALEVKVAWAEDLLDQLNMTVYRQQELIDRLLAELRALRDQLPGPGNTGPRSLRDELPPHY